MVEGRNESEHEISLSQQETDALNRHGVFLKKWLVQALSRIEGVGVISEELGVSYGDTRVMDVLAKDVRPNPELFFIFEAKRAYTVERRWIFFRDYDPRYRVLRMQLGLLGHSSVFAQSRPPHAPVWSEGYEYRKSDCKADQNPIFQAGAQVAAAYLGLIARRQRDFSRGGDHLRKSWSGIFQCWSQTQNLSF